VFLSFAAPNQTLNGPTFVLIISFPQHLCVIVFLLTVFYAPSFGSEFVLASCCNSLLI
jgi:hypothetical protein